MCDFQYPLNHEPILALLLYTDLYVVISKLLNPFGWQNIGGGGGYCPPAPLFLGQVNMLHNGKDEHCTGSTVTDDKPYILY